MINFYVLMLIIINCPGYLAFMNLTTNQPQLQLCNNINKTLPPQLQTCQQPPPRNCLITLSNDINLHALTIYDIST